MDLAKAFLDAAASSRIISTRNQSPRRRPEKNFHFKTTSTTSPTAGAEQDRSFGHAGGAMYL